MKEKLVIGAFVSVMLVLAGLVAASDFIRPANSVETKLDEVLAILRDQPQQNIVQSVSVEAESAASSNDALLLALKNRMKEIADARQQAANNGPSGHPREGVARAEAPN